MARKGGKKTELLKSLLKDHNKKINEENNIASIIEVEEDGRLQAEAEAEAKAKAEEEARLQAVAEAEARAVAEENARLAVETEKAKKKAKKELPMYLL